MELESSVRAAIYIRPVAHRRILYDIRIETSRCYVQYARHTVTVISVRRGS